MNMSHRVWAFCIVLWAGLSAARAASGEGRPNILFIMSDDHAYHALSCYGSRVNQTPQLDRLAREGVRFDRAMVVNSICTPSRASIITGKHSHLNGVPVFNGFDGSQQTVAKLLQAGGYHTGMIGKWHLGGRPTGFDRWIILPGQGVYNDPDFLTGEGRVKIKGYVTDVITDLGIEWLATRPKDKPFFMMLHHKAPHREWTPDPKHQAMFKNRVIPEPATLFDDWATRPAALPENEQTVARDMTRRDLKLEPPADLKGPELRRWFGEKPMELDVPGPDGTTRRLAGRELARWKYQRYLQDYLACVQSVDDNVGRLLDWMAENGLDKNTVVFYTADNGFFLGDLGLYDKRFMYEPSLRVPLLVRWPGVAKAGRHTERFALNIDYAPTFLEIAGLPVPGDMQGRSLVPLLRDEPPADWRTSMYYRYYHDPGHHNTRAHYGIRTATHKLIYYWKKDAYEMYDLSKDPEEQKNLADDPAHKNKLEEMKGELARLKKEAKDEDQFAEIPKDGGPDGAFKEFPPLGERGVKAAIAGSGK